MAITNHERIGKCLEQLTAGLQPFVERELKSNYQMSGLRRQKNVSARVEQDLRGAWRQV